MSPMSRTLVGMSNSGPFGIDPEEFDRVLRETGEGIRGVFDRLGRGAAWANVVNDLTRTPRHATQPETTGDTGDGVWVVYTVATDGGERVPAGSVVHVHALSFGGDEPGRTQLAEVVADGRLGQTHGGGERSGGAGLAAGEQQGHQFHARRVRQCFEPHGHVERGVVAGRAGGHGCAAQRLGHVDDGQCLGHVADATPVC